jgi:hypothetical protein
MSCYEYVHIIQAFPKELIQEQQSEKKQFKHKKAKKKKQ